MIKSDFNKLEPAQRIDWILKNVKDTKKEKYKIGLDKGEN